jgi:sugar lactone lactonase YvrE
MNRLLQWTPLVLASALFFGTAAAALASSAPLDEAERFNTPAGVDWPNGLAAMADGTVLVGGLGSGDVWQRERDGAWSRRITGHPELTAVTSLRFDAATGLLWGASPDALGAFAPGADPTAPRVHRLFAIDLRTGKPRWIRRLPEMGFGNDIALDGDGGAYVTDSRLGRVWQVSEDGEFRVAVDDARLRPGGIGPSGIVRLPDGSLVVGVFGAGQLYRARLRAAGAALERVAPDLDLIRPDGLALAPDGRLLVIEGGRGRLHAVDVETGTHRVLLDGLRGPVNLSVRGTEVWLTESGITDPAQFDPLRPPREAYALRRLSVDP